ncbi:MAG: hypothetical protein ACE5K7_05925, partial [Phycisphaerae bacterium]
MSVFDVGSGDALFRGPVSYSPGRLAAATDLSVVVAGPTSIWGPEFGHLYVVKQQPDGGWTAL